MSIDWRKVASFGLGIVQIIIPAVGKVEEVARGLPTLKGKAKEDAVVAMVKDALESSEAVAGHELANDGAVEAASRSVIQSYVALQNAVAAAKAIKALPPDPSQTLRLP